MISWARLALGQTQAVAEQETDVADDAIHPWPEQAGSTPSAVRLASAGPTRARRVARVMRFLAIAIAVATVAALFLEQGQHARRLEQQLASAQAQVGRLQEQQLALTQQLSTVQADRRALDERVSSLSVQLSSAISELQHANERLATTQELARALSQAQEERETQLARVTSERDAAQREADDLKQGQADLTRSVAHLHQRLALLDRDYRELSAQVAAAKAEPPVSSGFAVAAVPAPAMDSIPPAPPSDVRAASRPGQAGIELPVVRVETAPAAPSGALQGHLVSVNEPHRFVIIDQGGEDGVREGMVFDILQQGAPVGRAIAARVHQKLTACNLPNDGRTTPLLIGDLAVQQNP